MDPLPPRARTAYLRLFLDTKVFTTAIARAAEGAALAVARMARDLEPVFAVLSRRVALRARVCLRDGRRVHPSHVRPPALPIDGRAYHRRRTNRRNTR